MKDRTLQLLRVLQSAAEDLAGELPDQVLSAYVARDLQTGEEQLRLVVTPQGFDRVYASLSELKALQLSQGWRAIARYDTGWEGVPDVVVSATYPRCPFWWRSEVTPAAVDATLRKAIDAAAPATPDNVVALRSRT